jgi:hypothetical protein
MRAIARNATHGSAPADLGQVVEVAGLHTADPDSQLGAGEKQHGFLLSRTAIRPSSSAATSTHLSVPPLSGLRLHPYYLPTDIYPLMAAPVGVSRFSRVLRRSKDRNGQRGDARRRPTAGRPC